MSESRPCSFNDVLTAVGPTNRTFLDYYLSMPRDGGVPSRRDFEPARLTGIIGHLVIYERRGPAEFYIRLFGTLVVERLGYDATGTNIMDLFHYAQKDRIGGIFNTILDERRGHWSIVRDRFASGRLAKVEIIRVPMLGNDGRPSLIFASTQEIETTGYADRGDKPVLVAEPIDECFFDLD